MHTLPVRKSPQHSEYTKVGPARYSSPPSAGPPIVAVCCAAASAAIARVRCF